jgi:hypothetical protein
MNQSAVRTANCGSPVGTGIKFTAYGTHSASFGSGAGVGAEAEAGAGAGAALAAAESFEGMQHTRPPAADSELPLASYPLHSNARTPFDRFASAVEVSGALALQKRGMELADTRHCSGCGASVRVSSQGTNRALHAMRVVSPCNRNR